MAMKKPKTAIVPFSEVAKHGGRLDPGYYLGTNEEHDVEMANKYVKRILPPMLRRLFRVYKALVLSRWRVFVFRVSGKVKYD